MIVYKYNYQHLSKLPMVTFQDQQIFLVLDVFQNCFFIFTLELFLLYEYQDHKEGHRQIYSTVFASPLPILTKWLFRIFAICFESETVLLPSLTCMIFVELGIISSMLLMVLHMFLGLFLFLLIKDW